MLGQLINTFIMKNIDFENFNYWDHTYAIVNLIMDHYDEFIEQNYKISYNIKLKGVDNFIYETKKTSKEFPYYWEVVAVEDFIDQYDISEFIDRIETEEEKLTFKYNTEQEGQPTN